MSKATAKSGDDGAEILLGHHFTQPKLLTEALTHRSAAGARGNGSNERLEFIGDRVLGLIVAEWLIERFPQEREGALGPRLAALVSRPALAAIAEANGLAALLAVAPGESRRGVRERSTVLADALEGDHRRALSGCRAGAGARFHPPGVWRAWWTSNSRRRRTRKPPCRNGR